MENSDSEDAGLWSAQLFGTTRRPPDALRMVASEGGALDKMSVFGHLVCSISALDNPPAASCIVMNGRASVHSDVLSSGHIPIDQARSRCIFH